MLAVYLVMFSDEDCSGDYPDVAFVNRDDAVKYVEKAKKSRPRAYYWIYHEMIEIDPKPWGETT